jgi:diaminopimelate decarboxylase
MLHNNIGKTKDGTLTFAGVDVVALAKKHGTPLMIVDEEGIRQQCRLYLTAAKKHFGESARILYASKALCFKGLYKILRDEGVGADVISLGEMHTAVGGGMRLHDTVFHGNFKQKDELGYALANKVGRIVIDGEEDLQRIEKAAEIVGIIQKVQLRIIPAVNPDTHAKIITGAVDSKFGVSMKDGTALRLVKRIIESPNLELTGFHYHIGSQIFDTKPFMDAASNLMGFVAHLKKEINFDTQEINIGGGIAVRYVESQPVVDYEKAIAQIADTVKAAAKQHDVNMPAVWLEPGRSIVAMNCMTIYTVGAVKKIAELDKHYVIIDGGMTDNPRYALYGSLYTIYNAGKVNEKHAIKATISGRCCETGDIIQENVSLPKTSSGDIIAVACTGAYNYAMASNYNRMPRPSIIMIDKDGKDRLVVRRETFDDIVRLDA